MRAFYGNASTGEIKEIEIIERPITVNRTVHFGPRHFLSPLGALTSAFEPNWYFYIPSERDLEAPTRSNIIGDWIIYRADEDADALYDLNYIKNVIIPL